MSKSVAEVVTRHALDVGDVREVLFGDLIAKTGQGVGRIDGMVVFVLGPLPGERATVRITNVKAKYAVGELVELLERSPDRAEPFCKVFGRCGGCQVQHLAYDAQLAWKRGIVREALRRIGGIDAEVNVPIGMDVPRGYRNKMSLVVDGAPSARRFGFYHAGTHDVVPIDDCPIVLPQLDTYVAELWATSREAATGDRLKNVKHVISRVGRSSSQGVVAFSTERDDPGLTPIAERLATRLPGVVGISNAFEPTSENAVLGRKQRQLWGVAEMEESIGDVRFRVSSGSFFQVNSEMVGKIFTELRARIKRDQRIVDLYCGAGTFSLYFARLGARVLGVEENPNAVKEAHENAALNGLEGSAHFLSGRVDRVLRSPAGAESLAGADVVFLDPPRKGSDEATIAAIVDARVPELWYLSCNPATLARDLAQLCDGGYRLTSVQPFDMFPQTGHIEVLVCLERANDGAAPAAPKSEGHAGT